MKLRLEDESQGVLRTATDDVVIGVVNVVSCTLSLYRASWQVSARKRAVPGHRQLLELGQLKAAGHMGFSFHVKGGKLSVFYRNSILNSGKPLNCLTHREMDDIIVALGLPIDDDFRSYP